jgi:hypothetical protein
MLCVAAMAQVAQTPHTALRVLVTAREAHDLTLEEAERGYPIHLRAVVTYYDPYVDTRFALLFVHDHTGCIYARLPSRPILPLKAGNMVDLTGVSGHGDYAPFVAGAQVRIVGESHLPEQAQKATIAQLLSGVVDAQWVEIEGVVHTVHITAWNATLDIATAGGLTSATTRRETGAEYDQLVDSFVCVHGNAVPLCNRKRQMVGGHLLFPSLRQLTVLQAASADPFSLPARSINSLLRFTPGQELARRVRVQGRVTLQWPGRILCIQQESDGLCIQTAQATRVSTGDLVDVIGFPATSELKATLEDATFRLVGGSVLPPVAKPIWAGQVLQGDHDDELVRIEGELIGQDSATSDLSLILHSSNFLVLAVLPKNSANSGTRP